MNLAIIPARAGSKRIPRKNIKLFLENPMISYSILAAIDSGIFEKIIVSTDDEEIRSISEKYGAEVPFMRPADLSDDHTPINPVINHVIEALGSEANSYEKICCIYPCSPLLLPEDLQNSLKLMTDLQADSCIPVCEFTSSPQRAFKIINKKKLAWINPEFRLTRTQDLEKIYHDAGVFAWAKNKKWLQGDISDGVAYIMPNSRVADIDNPEDWKKAEILYKIMHDVTHF